MIVGYSEARRLPINFVKHSIVFSDDGILRSDHLIRDAKLPLWEL